MPKNWEWLLGLLMHDVSRLRRLLFEDYVRPLGLTGSRWWVLVKLYGSDGMTQTELADVLELGKTSVGRLIDRLEDDGFVSRISNAADRRVKRVVLSRKGQQAIQEMQVQSHEMSAVILEGLRLEQRETLVDLLLQVRKNLQARARSSGALARDERDEK